MTGVNRAKQIELALQQSKADGQPETAPDPIRKKAVPVVELPLDLPLLNPRSARIQPQLEDHPKVNQVNDDPYSAESQRIIAELVLNVHRNVDDLRESLRVEGQDQPGMITRAGVLINGNTRCVLLRQLYEAGDLKTPGTIKVGVLPVDYTDLQELELELVLQKQADLKDEYRLVNELFMIRRLHDQGRTPEQIGQSLRYRTSNGEGPADKVRQRLDVLQMMGAMRSLHDPPLQFVHFDNQKGKNNYEVWRALLDVYNELRDNESPDVVDAHLRRWLTAYFVGVDSVHNLRYAKGCWLEERVLGIVDENSTVRDIVDRFEAKLPPDDVASPMPEGLDLLGPAVSAGGAKTSPRVRAVFDAVVAARKAVLAAGPEGSLSIGDKTVVAGEFITTLRIVVGRALKDAKSDSKAAHELQNPESELERAREALSRCATALDAALLDIGFAAHRPSALTLAEDVVSAAQTIVARLSADDEAKDN